MDATTARRLLVAESRRLARVHDAIEDEPAGGDGAASDLQGADAAALTLEAEVARSLRDAVDDERAEIAVALVRVDQGTYGTCVGCGAPIADARLAVVPATRFCVGCEATGEHGGDRPVRPLVDHVLRTALHEMEDWADDGEGDDDVVVPSAEEAAVHARSRDRRPSP